jgi:hypothetical protein
MRSALGSDVNRDMTPRDASTSQMSGVSAGRGALGGIPSIEFSNNSTDPVTSMGVTAVAASSLTGPPLRGHRTFAGSGAVSQANVTIGVFWRF